MCERTDSLRALGRAAEALTATCRRVCSDDIGRALKSVYDDTLNEPVPDDLLAQLERLPERTRVRR